MTKEQLTDLVAKARETYSILGVEEESEKTLRDALIGMSTVGQIGLSMMDEIAKKETELANLKEHKDDYIQSIEMGLYLLGYEMFMESLDEIIGIKSKSST